MYRFLRVFFFLVSGCPLILFAQQSTSNMAGTVIDPTDAVVPQALLTATEVTTGIAHTGTTDDLGLFRFNDLPPGQYTLSVRASGFKALNVTGLDLAAGETRAVGKLVLQIGQLSDKVDVTAASTPVQTAS